MKDIRFRLPRRGFWLWNMSYDGVAWEAYVMEYQGGTARMFTLSSGYGSIRRGDIRVMAFRPLFEGGRFAMFARYHKNIIILLNQADCWRRMT